MVRAFGFSLVVALLAALSWTVYNANVTFTFDAKDQSSTLEGEELVSTSTGLISSESSSALSAPTTSANLETVDTKSGLSAAQLLALADNKFADGNVPLGDDKYTTSQPKKGYVFLCNVRKENPGSMVNGPWMSADTWNYEKKISVGGSVSWPEAKFSNSVSGSTRVLQGNALPISHTTGVFPVDVDDVAYKYDRNPNSISAQSLNRVLPAKPTYSETPYCMGGEVGVMLSGVPLFNAFDAGLRDALAHELQDSCDGHPQGGGVYHYHSLSSCFSDTSIGKVLGYALDGFPITGAKVAEGKYLTTEDLDVCHGITSEIVIDGKKTVSYHYVMTRDFPYSVSCFRGKPSSLMVIQGGGMPRPQQTGAQPTGEMPPMLQPPGSSSLPPAPPQEAIDACKGLAQGASCAVSTPDGMTITGRCDTPPGQMLACIPQ